MEPKEKALELFESFDNCADDGYSAAFGVDEETFKESRKQCALIAVNEILYVISGLEDSTWGFNAKSFHEEVKSEIEKI